ncbi:hypothetical protein H6501_04915 [Candidatus Woesearchaeota archaeon]|nr:hypothetical protein [Nanoarchaeota archaeon]MCB9370914.1 hypothetical protein [Candidatus Woesearchaeota archaeon]USN44015.1 MAG: hypothetical protein H6500_06520 [Candidatus Woesearchaeota archaeon]
MRRIQHSDIGSKPYSNKVFTLTTDPKAYCKRALLWGPITVLLLSSLAYRLFFPGVYFYLLSGVSLLAVTAMAMRGYYLRKNHEIKKKELYESNLRLINLMLPTSGFFLIYSLYKFWEMGSYNDLVFTYYWLLLFSMLFLGRITMKK